MATQPSEVWEDPNYPQPAMTHGTFFPQTLMPMVQPMSQPNSFLQSEILPQYDMGPAAPGLRGPFDPCLPHLPATNTPFPHPLPQGHFSQQPPNPALDHLQPCQGESSERSLGSRQRESSLEVLSSPSSTPPPDAPTPSFYLDNLDPGDSNVIGYQYVPQSERDVDWGRLFCGTDEDLGANVGPPSESVNPCPPVVAPLAGSGSDQTFRCSCCRKDQPVMSFSRDGSIPTELSRYMSCGTCRQKKRPYHQPRGDQSSTGSQAERPCIVCKAQRPVEGFPKVGSRPSRRCASCVGEGRQPEERPAKRPRSGSKESTSSSSRASPTEPVQPGHAYCSGCSKTQAVDQFADPRREGHLLRTCLQCRTRKNTADKKKREQRSKKN
ncbi:unnamed protein product [Clonostachys solani]|uniref:Uncharacterized protein n=1 Tax=Clonostachys solani TaxID=160281 RepID=A0A9P0ET90_9HYPO|nr:unnamed protein product [Clonostachys solani]